MTALATSSSVLALCAAGPGNHAAGERLRRALEAVRDWDLLVRDAEWHGLDALLLERARDHAVELPSEAATRLRSRAMQHAHAASVRAAAVTGVLDAFDAARIPVLLLKGAALAHLVYPAPRLRPMRDVDLLVAPQDADRAWTLVRERGFSLFGLHPGAGHHHLHALAAAIDGVTITIEIHTTPLAPAPLVAPLPYADAVSRARSFSYDGREARTLAPEDMLWHVYAHAFVVDSLHSDARLIALADLVLATEAWAAELDWPRLRSRYPRLVRALARIGGVVPWSPRVADRVYSFAPGAADDWRFDVSYGVDGPVRRVWSRLVVHPATVTLWAVDVARRRYLWHGHT